MDYKMLLANPTIESLTKLVNDAERATWPFIDVIRRNTILAKTFRKYLKLLKQREGKILSPQTATVTNIKAKGKKRTA